jgi:hypothetical protein
MTLELERGAYRVMTCRAYHPWRWSRCKLGTSCRRLGPPLAHFPRCPLRPRGSPSPKPRDAPPNRRRSPDGMGNFCWTRRATSYHLWNITSSTTISHRPSTISISSSFNRLVFRSVSRFVFARRPHHRAILTTSGFSDFIDTAPHHLDLPRRHSLSLRFLSNPSSRYQKLFINPFEGSCRAKAK